METNATTPLEESTAPAPTESMPVKPGGNEPARPRRRRRRVALLLVAVLVVVLVVVVLAVARNRREASEVRSSGKPVATSVDRSAPGSSGTATPGGGSADGSGEGGGAEPAAPPAPPEPPADANAAVALVAPSIVEITAPCEAIAPVDRPPCSLTVRWADHATDETGYRVEVDSQLIVGQMVQELPPDSTLYNRLFDIGDTLCVRVIALRDAEEAPSARECVTTSL